MSKKENNTFIKILIILVIASLALLAIVYVFNKAQKSEDISNLNTTNNIVTTAKEFNSSDKTLLNLETAEKTDRCGNFGCEPVAFTEGNWKNSEPYKLKFSHKNIEITLDDYQECSNEEYILPAYNITKKNGVEILRWDSMQSFYPCENKTPTKDFEVIIQEKASTNLNDYINDYNLIDSEHYDQIVDPDAVELLTYNNQEILYYYRAGMMERKCFLILGNNNQFNICYLRGDEDWEPNTKRLDNIKINSQNKIKDLLITTNDITDQSSLSLTGENFYLDGNILHVQVAYAGGCKEHDFELYWDGTFEETRIPRVNLNLVHDTTDTCEAYIIKDLQFDLSEMFEQYENNYNDSSEGFSIKIQSIEDSLEIFYKETLRE